MKDRTSCATPEALVTYLYEECEPAERELIAAHVAICASCAEEVQALGDTRAHLASWSPPALPLGFQITRTESDQPGKVLHPAAWYRQPLPAWAQMAAAVAIFAAGMSVSAFRLSGEQPARVVDSSPSQTASPAAERRVDDLNVTRAEFARIEARLRAVESADAYRASYTSPAVGQLDNNDVSARLRGLENYVLNKQIENSETLAKFTQALNANRRDLDAMRETTQKINVLDEELQDHRQVLLNPIFMRTALTSSAR